ncbi:MAG TPA: AAA family ATPase, partial [Methanocorpusculum sp.]|nr:AAA family ATPase [Methanocorpusculum sp.]
EGRKQILDVYLREVSEMISDDVSVDTLVEKTEGFVGADIEALVREAKMTAIREFIRAMAGRDAEEISLAVASVKIFSRHFDAALQRVRPSLDSAGRRAAEKNSWQYRYNEEERKLLEKALNKIEAAEYADIEPDTEISELELLITAHQKDFSRIKEILKQ